MGAYAVAKLGELQRKHSCIREVRGLGLLIGVELRDDPAWGNACQLAEWLMYEAMARGLSFKVSSGCVLTLAPPLIITQDQLDEALQILDACFAAARNR